MPATKAFSCLSTFDFFYAFLTCLKMVTITGVPGWDAATARAAVDLDEALDYQIREMRVLAVLRRSRIVPGTKFSTAANAQQQRMAEDNGGGQSAEPTQQPQQQQESAEDEDLFDTLAKKLMVLKDIIKTSLDSVMGESLARVASTGRVMTVRDAIDEFFPAVDGILWQNLLDGMDWEAFKGFQMQDWVMF
jgi:hypothetical protein